VNEQHQGFKMELLRLCRVPLQLEQQPTVRELEAFLSKPIRPLRGLLSPERLSNPEPLIYAYNSRPHQLARWTIQPQVRLKAEFVDQALQLEQLSCRVEGLGEWQSQLHLGLSARIRAIDHATVGTPTGPGDAGGAQLEAEATAWGLLPASARPLAPVLRLALIQLLDRMERRCHKGLRRRAEAWLVRQQLLKRLH
jgi:hypothetical protein